MENKTSLNILSIDLDYILAPCINLYNDFVFASNPPQKIWDNLNSLRNIDNHISYDDENLKLLVGDTEEGECRTVIGRETGISALSDCSLVVKTYSPSDNMKGSIGIIGPARMDYSRVMSTLEYMAEAMDNILRRMLEP